MKKKIFLLTASYGTGHTTANKYIQKALLDLYNEKIDTITMDFLKMKGYDFTGNLFQKLYNKSMENPKLWEFAFNISNNKISQIYFKYMIPLFYSSVYKTFERETPNVFVATYPYWIFLVGNYKKKYNKNIPLITVVTDSTAIHSTWIDDATDYYIVIDGETKDVLLNFGVESNKIFVMGFPVNPELGKKINKVDIISNLGFDYKLPIILIVIGLGAINKFIKLINLMNEQLINLPVQALIITGKYENVYRILSLKKYNFKTKIIGWTDRMADFLRISDIVIAKGGGAIVNETLAAGKPMIIPVFVPGQEKGNAYYLKKYGLGFQEQSLEKVVEIVKDLILSPDKLLQLQNHISKYNKPDAAINIAKFIYSLIE